jgi:hypothetical protein
MRKSCAQREQKLWLNTAFCTVVNFTVRGLGKITMFVHGLRTVSTPFNPQDSGVFLGQITVYPPFPQAF